MFIHAKNFLFSDLLLKMSHNTDYDELLWTWKGWRDATGPSMREKYIRFVELQNEAARLNGMYYSVTYPCSPYMAFL